MRSTHLPSADLVATSWKNHDLPCLTVYANIGHRNSLPNWGVEALGFVVMGILLVVLDQGTKLLAVKHLQPGSTLVLPGNLVYLTLVRNPGAAFGILAHATPFLVLLTLGVLAIVWVNRRKLKDQPTLLKLGLCLGLAGAVGNLVDRVRLGYVVDFVDLRFWPVFNVADMGIVAGVLILLWLLIVQGRHEG
jgi:signal peptidase II